MQRVLEELVGAVESSWRRAHYAEPAFAAVAAEALESSALHRNLDIEGELAAIVRGDHSQELFVGTHSAPGVIPLFTGARFTLCLHVWYDDLAMPHSHAWAGAYQVLAGSSIQANFTFEEHTVVDPKFRLGSLEMTRLELLMPGATRSVVRGGDLIHGLGYVERPGVALSVRTRERFGGLTCDYWSPGVCIETGFLDPPTRRRIKSLNALYAIDPALCAQALESAVSHSDMRSCFFLLRHAMTSFRDQIDMAALGAAAASSLGPHGDTIMMALQEIERDATVRKRRKEVRNPEQRFLLTALHLAPDREAVKRLVSARYPGEDPEEFMGPVTASTPAWRRSGSDLAQKIRCP